MRTSFMCVPLMNARSARDPFPDRISESFRANYLKFGVVSGREDNGCAGVFWMRGRERAHACGDARVIGVCSLARPRPSRRNFMRQFWHCFLPPTNIIPSKCPSFPLLLLPKVGSQSHADEMQDRRPLPLVASRALKLQRNRGICIRVHTMSTNWKPIWTAFIVAQSLCKLSPSHFLANEQIFPHPHSCNQTSYLKLPSRFHNIFITSSWEAAETPPKPLNGAKRPFLPPGTSGGGVGGGGGRSVIVTQL